MSKQRYIYVCLLNYGECRGIAQWSISSLQQWFCWGHFQLLNFEKPWHATWESFWNKNTENVEKTWHDIKQDLMLDRPCLLFLSNRDRQDIPAKPCRHFASILNAETTAAPSIMALQSRFLFHRPGLAVHCGIFGNSHHGDWSRGVKRKELQHRSQRPEETVPRQTWWNLLNSIG